MSFIAALLAFLDELLKGINLAQTGAQRAADRQAGADALAASTSAATSEIADAQGQNDIAARDLDGVIAGLRAGPAAGPDGGAGGALRPPNGLDGAAKG
jgi:hypothetical protein